MLLVAVPFVGIVVQLKRGNALPIFGVWELASPWPADRAVPRSVLGVREVLANLLLILAGIHSGAALIHHYAFATARWRGCCRAPEHDPEKWKPVFGKDHAPMNIKDDPEKWKPVFGKDHAPMNI